MWCNHFGKQSPFPLLGKPVYSFSHIKRGLPFSTCPSQESSSVRLMCGEVLQGVPRVSFQTTYRVGTSQNKASVTTHPACVESQEQGNSYLKGGGNKGPRLSLVHNSSKPSWTGGATSALEASFWGHHSSVQVHFPSPSKYFQIKIVSAL